MTNRYSLNKSAANYGRLYKDDLETVYHEFPDSFKMREAKEMVGWDHGIFQKLHQAGLIENRYVGHNDPMDWSLTRQTKRWLESRTATTD